MRKCRSEIFRLQQQRKQGHRSDLREAVTSKRKRPSFDEETGPPSFSFRNDGENRKAKELSRGRLSLVNLLRLLETRIVQLQLSPSNRVGRELREESGLLGKHFLERGDQASPSGSPKSTCLSMGPTGHRIVQRVISLCPIYTHRIVSNTKSLKL
uniref:Uncharacterized protein n=1 Tax=Nelumbo nucifera TaxID=4432 RepID=A0A822XIT7_NELNU|nr:TPA_asm: hypothetical protein HUJ06_021773 [Nelumbo nucifera]